jgi:hypothetical protein
VGEGGGARGIQIGDRDGVEGRGGALGCPRRGPPPLTWSLGSGPNGAVGPVVADALEGAIRPSAAAALGVARWALVVRTRSRVALAESPSSGAPEHPAAAPRLPLAQRWFARGRYGLGAPDSQSEVLGNGCTCDATIVDSASWCRALSESPPRPEPCRPRCVPSRGLSASATPRACRGPCVVRATPSAAAAEGRMSPFAAAWALSPPRHSARAERPHERRRPLEGTHRGRHGLTHVSEAAPAS